MEKLSLDLYSIIVSDKISKVLVNKIHSKPDRNQSKLTLCIMWYNRIFPAWTNVSKDLTVNLLNELYSSHDISYDTSNEYKSAFGLLWLLNHSDIFMLLTTTFRLLLFFSTTYQVLRRFGCSSKKCLLTYNLSDILLFLYSKTDLKYKRYSFLKFCKHLVLKRFLIGI